MESDEEGPSGGGALVLLAFVCVLAAVGLRLVAEFHGIVFVYASIALSALAAALLIFAARRRKHGGG